MVPIGVPTVETTRATIAIPSPRVPRIVAPPRVIELRVPMISQEDKIEDTRKIDVV